MVGVALRCVCACEHAHAASVSTPWGFFKNGNVVGLQRVAEFGCPKQALFLYE
jgi:hypothetical protein